MVELKCINCDSLYSVKPYRKDTSKYCCHKCEEDYRRIFKGVVYVDM